jgi:2-polyprenyl-3-methyl-5-hydroxy-6-metoxy-1,4-benzoquinol methylase
MPHRRLPGLSTCSTCGFVTADLALTAAELAALYGTDYFHGDEYADYVSEQPELRTNFRRRLDTLRKLQPPAERQRLYEVGAAYGFFLDEAASFYESVAGIDISEDAAVYAKRELGVDVVAGDYLSTDLPALVDVVCMWDTIEHLAQPREFVHKAARDVRPGGLVALTTGDISSLNARVRGAKWRMIHPPTHLQYFSRRTLTRLLDDAGFDIVHVETAGNARSLRGILYAVIVLRGGRPALFERLRRLPGLDRSLTIDLRDIIFVVGRRRADSRE